MSSESDLADLDRNALVALAWETDSQGRERRRDEEVREQVPTHRQGAMFTDPARRSATKRLKSTLDSTVPHLA